MIYVTSRLVSHLLMSSCVFVLFAYLQFCYGRQSLFVTFVELHN